MALLEPSCCRSLCLQAAGMGLLEAEVFLFLLANAVPKRGLALPTAWAALPDSGDSPHTTGKIMEPGHCIL